MKKSWFLSVIILFFFIIISGYNFGSTQAKEDGGETINLLKPSPANISLDRAIKKRRTTRDFDRNRKVSLQELSNILYAMQGQTEGKKRTVASGMGAYPLELYIVANNVNGLADGMYKMDIPNYRLKTVKRGDFRNELSAACMSQAGPKNAQVKIIVTSVWNRFRSGIGEMGKSFGMFEAGEASQNAYLMAAALNLHAIPIGGMNPEAVAKVIGVNNKEESPLIVNCIGR